MKGENIEMTNAEKFLKDGVDVEELVKKMVGFELNDVYADEIARIGLQKQAERFERFFTQPLKPILTEDEKVILRNISKEYLYIYRNKAGNIELHKSSRFFGATHIYHSLEPFMHLFQFIQSRRRI